MSLRTLLLVTAAAVSALASVAGAGAARGTTVTGTIVVQSVTQLAPPRSVGGNVILDDQFSGIKSGLWSWTDVVRFVIHPDGHWTAHGQGTFAGAAPGCGDVSGAWNIEGQGTLNPDGSLNGGGHAHSIDGSTTPGGFRFSEDWALDGSSGPYRITYSC